MANIFINGFNAKSGGGKSILSNLLRMISEKNIDHDFYVLTPDEYSYSTYDGQNITFVCVASVFRKLYFLPFVNAFLIPRLIKKYTSDLVLNLSDLPIPTSTPQIYLFDWPYAVYPQSEVWNRMDFKSLMVRKAKLFFFKRYLYFPEIVIAQSETMKKRLKEIYNLRQMRVVPNAVSLENMNGGEFYDFDLPENKTKFLYLTYYYPHKNIEIFLDLARKFKKRNDPYCIVTTISATQHKCAAHFLEAVRSEELGEYIVNVGPVDMANVPSLYQQTDALLMPTLLESFSGTYVEAMYHGKMIFTSDYDFAKDVCQDAAFYFDPLNFESILNTIDFAYSNGNIRLEKINEGYTNLEFLLTWEDAFEKIMMISDEVLQDDKNNAK
jgi:glycosyltransferase involved in cell wall biosynthesis